MSHPDEARLKGLAARERCKEMYDMHNLELGLYKLVEQVIEKQSKNNCS